MNPEHKKILEEIKKLFPGKTDKSVNENRNGNRHKYYGLTDGEKREIAENWASKNTDIDFDVYFDVVDSLIFGESFDEKIIGAEIIHGYPELKSQIIPRYLSGWLLQIEGTTEVDALCLDFISYKDLKTSFTLWGNWIKKFSLSHFAHIQRASAILLIKLVRVEDEKVKDLAFQVLDNLKSEKNALITKAIPLLLDSMKVKYKKEVNEYVKKNKEIKLSREDL